MPKEMNNHQFMIIKIITIDLKLTLAIFRYLIMAKKIAKMEIQNKTIN